MNLYIQLSPIVFQFKYTSYTTGTSESSSNLMTLLITIIAGGAVSILTVLVNDWFKERRQNKNYFRADLLKIIKLLKDKKNNPMNGKFELPTLFPYTEKKLIKTGVYNKIQQILETQFDKENVANKEIDLLISILNDLI